MWKNKQDSQLKKLQEAHHPDSIQVRLSGDKKSDYLSDAVLGGIDGSVTTFAIVAGTMGGGFEPLVALALGLSNLVADGFSMAVSNYQATSSVRAKISQVRKEEAYHIQMVPEGEREEIRQLFSQKGFSGDLLEHIVETITADEKIWIDTMLQEEHGLPLESSSPLKSAFVTFISFCLVGLLPLLPFFILVESASLSFKISCLSTAVAFVSIGLIKGKVLGTSMLKEGLEVLFFGSLAASFAFGISYWAAHHFQSMT